ncbi:MAG: ubiquinol-cytochrome c reductase iron-sulfur subunit [candidate division Zixibacteria bacterium]|nr:ubiquinol-cytochrome c reductase iron-sulfur subunit [candidate division Zixibacteria bacterium]
MPDKNVSRRGFFEILATGGILGVCAMIFYPIWKYITPPESGEANLSQIKLDFSRADIEAEEKKSKTFKFGRKLGIIIVASDGTLKAMAATCTHLDCTVQHRPDLGIIWCSCHNGRYDLDGNNISGPPPRPLEQYVVNEIDGDIFVSKEETNV